MGMDQMSITPALGGRGVSVGAAAAGVTLILPLFLFDRIMNQIHHPDRRL